jgi:hypothetical protein
MSVAKFKTLRHIETVRNYINMVIHALLMRQEQHDQTKLQEPEASAFEIYTEKLRGCTYGSPEYHQFLKEMQVPLDHHYAEYRHHPEHFPNGIQGMNLIDLLEMICDWKSSTMRHHDGDIMKSIDINQKRFGYSDELKAILVNTAKWMNDNPPYHKAEES